MEETKVAIRAAKEAGNLLMENFGKVHDVEEKSKHEILTETDLESERTILGILKSEYPGHSILSEEAGKETKESEFMWVVDPLDGSTNYSIRIPFFNVSIALTQRIEGKWEVVSGVVHAPFTREVFFAERGEGCFLNGEKASVSREEDLKKLILTYCHGYSEKQILRSIELYSKMKPVCRDLRRVGAAALELAYLACGRVGCYVAPGLKPWDTAAGSLLVEEAGGKVSDFSGREWDVSSQEMDILASNGVIHEKILEIMKNIK